MPRPMALLLATTIALVAATAISAADATLPLLVEDDFEHGADRWAPTDAKAWKITEIDGGKVYDQFKDGAYRGPHRSPYNISLLKDVVVGDFVLTVKVKSTDPAGGAHRDVCLFFGYQDPANFYYVHLGERPDPNSSQIMIVDDAPRKMITTNESPGIPWDEKWHTVKIVRRVGDGTIEVYFDDMKKPRLVANDKTFTFGQVGLGSFDNTGQWDDFKLQGVKVEKK